MKQLTRQDMLDILQGVAILGGGGGGQMAEGQLYMENALAKTTSVRLVSLTEIEDDTLLCSVYRIGTLSDSGKDAYMESTDRTATDAHIIKALRVMEKHLGKTIRGFIPGETGVVATLLSFFIAASVDNGFIVDADPTGRSVPGLNQDLLWSSDLPPRAIAAVSTSGEAFLEDGVINADQGEKVLRGLCIKHSNMWTIDHAMSKGIIGSKLAPGTVSRALAIGRDWRGAKEEGADVAETIARKYSGTVVFRGVMSSVEQSEKNGFTFGCSVIEGSGEFDGRTYRVDYKNENMVGWLDEQVNVTVPEIITLFNEDGDVVLNQTQKIGDVVTVVVLPAPAHYLTEEGLKMFGPSYCGLTQEFKSALAS